MQRAVTFEWCGRSRKMVTERSGQASVRRFWKRVFLGCAGIALGGLFFFLASRNVNMSDLQTTLRQTDAYWLSIGVALYLASISLRCVRWGILLRATGGLKWRHAAEALITGYSANYVLPGRLGEFFRADYARRVFNMSRFTALGTIVAERVCDGVILVLALWTSIAILFATRLPSADTPWVITVGAVSAIVFGAALVFILVSERIELRRFGILEGIAARWDRLVVGISSVLRGRTWAIVLCSVGIWSLEALTLASIVRSFGINLSAAEAAMLLGLASLSTLVPTAPGYIGTYQLVFGHVFRIFGYPDTIGFISASAIQILCFGTVTILGGLVLLSRSGLTMWRAHKWAYRTKPN
jgi:glycosyltransferase 2 family protein